MPARRALELLAGAPDGMTEALVLAHGFTIELPADLVRGGLASAQSERTVAAARRSRWRGCGSPRRGGRRWRRRSHEEAPKASEGIA